MFGIDDSIIGGVVSGAASLIGGANNNAQSAKNVQQQFVDNLTLQEEAQNFNANQASVNWANTNNAATTAFGRTQQLVQNQQNYETQMSNTAYQRQVADMKAAGLNPIMAAGGGGGASTPTISAPGVSAATGSQASSGGQSSVQAAQTHDIVSPAVSSALQGARLSSELDQIKAQTKNLGASADLTGSNKSLADQTTKTQEEITRKAKNEADASQNATDEINSRIRANTASANASNAQAAVAAVKASQDQDWGDGSFFNTKTYAVPGNRALNAVTGGNGRIGTHSSDVYGALYNMSPPNNSNIGGSTFTINGVQ